MKKFLIAIVALMTSISFANAERFSMGVTVKGGVFEADGASEIFSGDHAGNRSSTKVTKSTATEGEDAEAAYAMGSIFLEAALSDQVSLGINYVPHSMETETATNTQNTNQNELAVDAEAVNTVSLSFEDLTTAYVMLNATENLYIKVGLMEVEAITKENLATGGSYGNATLEGISAGFGYNGDLANDMFFRLEANYMDFDGAEKTNSNDANKKIKVDGITGFGGKISVGRSF